MSIKYLTMKITLLFISLFLLCINFSYAESTKICNSNNQCYEIKTNSYNNVKFTKYNRLKDLFIFKSDHATINTRISNLKLKSIRSKNMSTRTNALQERDKLVNILKNAKTIDLKDCIFTGYYSCNLYINNEDIEYFKDDIIED